AGKSITYAAGAGAFDMSAGTGTFKTGTGAITLNGDASFAAGKALTIPAGSGTKQGLKLTSGTNLTTPVAGDSGSVEYDGTNISFINSAGARQTLATSVAGGY